MNNLSLSSFDSLFKTYFLGIDKNLQDLVRTLNLSVKIFATETYFYTETYLNIHFEIDIYFDAYTYFVTCLIYCAV